MYLSPTTINPRSKISLRRMLPGPGEVLVQPGQPVEALTVVARAEMPSRYRVINVARQLNRPQVDMNAVMLSAVGDYVKANQVIATHREGLPLFRRSVRAPAAGLVAAIGPGWVLLETERTTLEVQAFINGRVNQILSNRRGVIIEAQGAMIEAACGFGGEAHGRLQRLVNSPYEALNPDTIDEHVSKTIALGGRTVDEETLRKAEAWQVRGIIVGSIESSLLKLDPPSKVRVVATEGFGNLPMSTHTFSLLTSLSRREISIRGQTPHLRQFSSNRWVDESPIILATDPSGGRSSDYAVSHSAPDKQKVSLAGVGSRVRVTQGTLLGTSGTIESIPAQSQATEVGIIAAGANVRLNNEVRFIPWANLEIVV